MARGVKLFNTVTGQVEEIAPEKAASFLRSGTHHVTSGEAYNLVDDWGQVKTYSGTEVYDAITDPKFRFETEQEEHGRYIKENYGGFADGAAATGLGFARGATLGLSDLVGKAVGAEDVIADYSEAFPTASTAGEIAGIVGPALLSGGAGAAGAVARATPAAQVLRAGTKFDDALQLALRSGTNLDKSATVVARGLSNAAEGAAFGGGLALSEEIIGNPEMTGETALAAMAEGAAFGALADGALGFAFGGIGSLMGKGKKAQLGTVDAPITGKDEVLQRWVGGALAPADELTGISGAGAKMASRMSAALSGKTDPTTLAKMDELFKNNRSRQIALIDDAKSKISEDLVPTWRQASQSFDQAIYGAEGAGKAGRVAKIAEEVDNIPLDELTTIVRNSTSNVKKVLGEVMAEADEFGETAARGQVRKMIKMMEAMEDDYIKMAGGDLARAPAIAYKSLDDMAQALGQRISDSLRKPTWQNMSQDARRRLGAAREILVENLTDANIWGDAAASKMKRLRGAAASTLSHDAVANKLMRQTGQDFYRKIYELDDNKVGTLLNRLSRGEDVSLDVREVKALLKDQKHQLNEHLEMLTLDAADKKLHRKALKELTQVEDTIAAAEEVLKQQQDLGTISRLGGGINLGAIGGAQVARGLGLAGVATEALTPGSAASAYILGSAISAVTKPAQLLRGVEQLAKLRRGVEGKLRTSARGIVSGKHGANKAIPVSRAVTAAVAGQQGQGLTNRRTSSLAATKEAQRAVETLQQLQTAGPRELYGQFPGMDMTPRTRDAMVQAQMRGASFLSQKAGELGINTSIRVSPAKLARFKAYARAVSDPLGEVIVPTGNGVLKPDGVEVIKEVYPRLHEAWVAEVWEAVQSDRLPASARRAMSVLLDVPFDKMSSPAVMGALQNTQNVMAPTPNAQGSGRPASDSRLKSTADASLTTAQRLSAK